MRSKTTYPFIHLLAVLLTPLMFACAHSKTEDTIDGYADVEAAISDDSNYTLGEVVPEAVDSQIETAKQAVASDAKPAPAQKVLVTKPRSEPKTVSVFPSKPVIRNGSTLNRYYFLRAGDTPERLSRLFYGNPNRAAEIVEWNGQASTWEPGQVLYYRSEKDAEDERMVSYYFEAGVPAQDRTLQADENLMTVAKQLYGSPDSWKEIAVLNGLGKGTEPLPGATIKVYPAQLIRDPESVPLVVASDKVISVPKNPEAPSKLASAEIGDFIRNNPVTSICGIVALVLLGLYFVVVRRRYRSPYNF